MVKNLEEFYHSVPDLKLSCGSLKLAIAKAIATTI